MARKNKTPLKQVVMDGPSTDAYGDKDGLLDDLDINFDTQFDTDKMLGAATGAIQPKNVDNTGIDAKISQVEKPASGSVYDKMAARYRSQGEGKVLRTQKNLTNLFSPTITLIKEREAAAQARFTLLKDKMPEFDDSTIFGNLSGNEMPIKDYVMGVSKSVKEDLRMLSRLNPNDERYDEIKKRVDKNQKAIVDFDDINQQLLKIRNTDNDESQWSAGMDQTTADMWRDIYSSKGENIKIVDGKLVWTDTRGENSYEFNNNKGERLTALGGNETALGLMHYYSKDFTNKKLSTLEETEVIKIQQKLNELNITDDENNSLDEDGEWGPKTLAAYRKYVEQKDKLETAYLDENLPEGSEFRKTTGTGGTRTIDLSQIGDGPTMIDNVGLKKDIEIQDAVQGLINSDISVDDPRYDAKVNQLVRNLNSAGPKGIKSLIFDGIDGDPTDPLASTNTDAFIEDVIRYNHGEDLSEAEIDKIVDEMRDKDVTFSYKNSEGKDETLQSQYIKWYRNQIDLTVKEGKKSKIVASSNQNNNNNNNNNNRRNRTTTTTTNTNPTETSTNENDNFSAPFIERFGTDTNEMFTELTTENATYIGGGKNDGTTSGNLFNYGDDAFVENTLNRTYGSNADTFGDTKTMEHGTQDDSGPRMSFRFVVNDEDVSWYEGDRVTAWYRDRDGKVTKKTYEFDNMSGDEDQAKAMQTWMRGKVEDDMDAAKASMGANEVYVGEEGGSYEGTTTDNTTDNTTTDNTTTTDNATTFRSTMSSGEQTRVNKFSVIGTSGAGKANIFKNGKPITAKVKVAGGFVTVNITGVRAEGDELIVGTSRGDQDLGKFVKHSNKYVFIPGDAYQYLDGEDKKDFDAFKNAIQSDNAFAEKVNESVAGTTNFKTKNY